MQYEKHTLKNGLRVIIVPMKNTQAVIFQIFVKTGAKNENKKINGVSHFLEHLVFKGSRKRPKPGMISKELDRIGAENNAFTSKEVTGFWVKSASKDFDIGLDVISDIVLNPIFDAKEIEKERGVILQEISMYEDEPVSIVARNLDAMIYGDNPHAMPVLGDNESVKRISRNDILKYKKSQYIAKNIIVVVAGNIEPMETFKKIKNIFKNFKSGDLSKLSPPKIKQKDIAIDIKTKKCDQSHIAVGVRAYGVNNEKKYALNVLAVILGGNMSSRLYTEIREKSGLAYYVGALGVQYEDSGYLRMRAGVPKEKIYLVFEKISKIMNDFKNKKVSKDELHFAKENIRGRMALSLEGSDEVADFYGEQELFGDRIFTPDEYMKKIEKVTASDIMKVAKDIFRPESINIAGIIPEDGKEIDSDKIKKIFFK